MRPSKPTTSCLEIHGAAWPSATSLKLPWVLVVDDDRISGRSIGRWLSSSLGWEVRLARTIHQACCWTRCMGPPEALITDFELSDGEDGVVLISTLRSVGCGAPAAVLTGAPELAKRALLRQGLGEYCPVIKRGQHQEPLAAWLGPQSAAVSCSA